MNINLDSLSREDLEKLRADVDKALKTLEARRRAEARKAAESAAKEFGFSLGELVSDTPAKGAKGTKGSKGEPKYAHPENPSQTWTGRGRKPNWVIAALESGKSLEDLAI